jgi:hypothetical protein
MAAPAKRSLVYGFLLKKESTYGTYTAPSASTDALLMQFSDRYQASVGVEAFDFDGDLGPSSADLGELRRVRPSGKSIAADIPVRFKGAGVAYAAGTKPEVHTALEVSGFTPTGSFTASSEKYTYALTGDVANPSSGSGIFYGHGEERKGKGLVANWSFAFDNQAPPIHTFRFLGIFEGNLADAAVPATTYLYPSIVPPLAGQITATIGAWGDAIIYGGSFDMGRQIDNPRVPLNNTGTHLGVLPGGHQPRLRLTIERPAISAYNYETKRDTAVAEAIALTFGSTQYNRWKLNLDTTYLISATPSTRGSVATLDLEYACVNSALGTEDAVEVVFD